MDKRTHRTVAAVIGAYNGASFTIAHGGKHPKVRIRYGGDERVIVKSVNSGCPHAERNFAADVRRALKDMGYGNA